MIGLATSLAWKIMFETALRVISIFSKHMIFNAY